MSRITFVQEDVLNLHHVDAKIDQIYHLDLSYDFAHPVEALLKNSLGTLNVLRLAYVKRARTVIVIDYSQPGEQDSQAYVRTSLSFIEALSASYASEKGTDVRIARFYLIYGSKEDWLFNMLVSMAKNEDITSASGEVFPVHLSDAADGLMKLMNYSGADAQGRAFDFLGPKMDLEDLLKTAKKMIGSSSKIYSVKKRQTRFGPDSQLAYEVLQWKPKMEIEMGMAKVIQQVKKGERGRQRGRAMERARGFNNQLQSVP